MTDQGMNEEQINFDRWSDLATNDRSEFETLRRTAIEAFINSAPEERRERLVRLQWRIDQERTLSSSALGSCVRISKLMWEQVVGERGLLGQLKAPLLDSEAAIEKAEVIPLVRE